MVNIAHEITKMTARYSDGGEMYDVGPTGRAISDAHKDAFLAELRRLAAAESRITVDDSHGTVAILIDGGQPHAYWTYSGVGMDSTVPETDDWTAFVSVSYSSDEFGSYPLLSERHRVGIYRDPVFCASIALAAIKAHMAADFAQLAEGFRGAPGAWVFA